MKIASPKDSPFTSPGAQRACLLAVSVAESVLSGLDADFSFAQDFMAEADALQLPASEEEAHEQQLDMMDPSQKAMRNAADGALRQAICCGALSPLRRSLDAHAEHASPSVLAEARRFRERLRIAKRGGQPSQGWRRCCAALGRALGRCGGST